MRIESGGWAALLEPFKPEQMDWLIYPREKAAARGQEEESGQEAEYLCLPNVDPRIYMERLDALRLQHNVVWETRYDVKSMGAQAAVVCELQLREQHEMSVVRSGIGVAPMASIHTANAQALRRACSEFGLGRYLYEIPKLRLRLETSVEKTRRAIDDERDVLRILYAEQLVEYERENGVKWQPLATDVARPTIKTAKEKAANV